MINCRSLLYWGVRIPLVLPQTPWSSFPELLFFFLYCKTLFFLVFFCLQQKPTSYLFLHKLFTSSQPPLPPPCSCATIATCRTRVSQCCQRISPETCDSKCILQSKLCSLLLNVFHRFSEWMCLFHTSSSVCILSGHVQHSCRQPVSLLQFVRLARGMLGVLPFLVKTFSKGIDCCLVCKYQNCF